MTTLADLKKGDAFAWLARVTDLDQVTGMTMILYGPGREPQGQLIISPQGVFSGQLANPFNQTPVHTVAAFRAVSIGDVMVNNTTGETMVVRQVSMQSDGTYQWASSQKSGAVFYTMDAWTISGTATAA